MEDLNDLADTLIRHARRTNTTIVAADAEGAAEYFHGGFITYTKEHKIRALGVPALLLRDKGAVRRSCARDGGRCAQTFDRQHQRVDHWRCRSGAG